MRNESRTIRSVYNIICGIIFKVVGMFFPFLIKTIIIHKIGVEYLGLNSLFASILNVLSLSELGISGALVFKMYKPIAENDIARVNMLLKIYRDIYRIIGVVIAVLGLLIMPFLNYFISGDYPQDVNIYILYDIYLLNSVLSYFLFAYKKSILEAHQLNGDNSILETFTTLLMYIFQIITLLLFSNYYIYVLIMPISTIVLNLVRCIYVDKKFPEYKCEGNVDKEIIKELYLKVKALIGHKIGNTVITSADSIIISAILGLNVLAIYSNYYLIISSIVGLITIFYTSITASVGNQIVSDSTENIKKNFYILNFINSWIVGWSTICLICLFQPFMMLWMGKELMFEFEVIVLFGIYFYSWLIRRIGLTYKDAAGMWEDDFWKPYIGIIVNIIANIILCKCIGVSGAIISTIFVMIVIYFPWETKIVFSKILKCNSQGYYKKIIYYSVINCMLIILTYIVCSLIKDVSITGLIIKFIICLIIPNSIYLCVYRNLNEFKELVKKFPLNKILKNR